MRFENKGKWTQQIAESAQKNEDGIAQLEDLVLYITHNGQQKFSEQELIRRIKELCSPSTSENDIRVVAKKHASESAQVVEAIGPDEIVSYSKQMDFKKQYLKGKDARKVNSNSFYFDGNNAVDDNTGSSIPGAKLGIKYKELAAALDKFFGESAQVNESRSYTVIMRVSVPDSMNNVDLEDALWKTMSDLGSKTDIAAIDIDAKR